MPQVSSGSLVTLQRQEVRKRADLIVTFMGGTEAVVVVVLVVDITQRKVRGYFLGVEG